jgi:copper transport protein
MHLDRNLGRRCSGGRRAARARLLALILLAMVLCVTRHNASAHAVLVSSDPPADAVLTQTPPAAQLSFSEPIEPTLSRVELFDAHGQRVQTSASQPGATAYVLTLALPSGLADGTYAIAYHTISAADGHTADGFVTFTIGSTSDSVAPTPPNRHVSALPRGSDGLARVASLGGALSAVGVLLCWLSVLRPALTSCAPRLLVSLGMRNRRLVLGAICVALGGSVAALVVQITLNEQRPRLAAVQTVISESHYGHVWVLRVALLCLLGAYAWPKRCWQTAHGARYGVLGLAIGAAALAPFALSSHAASDGSGRTTAITMDWLHLCAAAAWIGGLLALSLGMVAGMRRALSDIRRTVLAAVLPRFATTAITSICILALTGLYSAWLEVGNVDRLRSTAYGHALLVKLGLLVAMLALGGFNHFFIGPRVRRSSGAVEHFRHAVALEAALGIVILLVVGVLTSLPPARDAATTHGLNARWTRDGLTVALRVSPGGTGINRLALDAVPTTGTLPDGTQALLRISQGGVLRGERDVALEQTSATHFEKIASDLSIAGPWTVEVILRRPNTADWRMTTTLEVAPAPVVGAPAVSTAHFSGWQSLSGTLLGAVGCAGLVVGLRPSSGRKTRVRTLAGSSALTLLAVALLWLGWSVGSSRTTPAVAQVLPSRAAAANGTATPGSSSHDHGVGTAPADACALLQPADIQAVTGAVTSTGTPLVDLHNLPKCAWLSGKGSTAQTIIVRVLPGSDTLTTALGVATSRPLAGIGDAAAWNASARDLVVRVGDGGFEMQIVAVQDEALPAQLVDALATAAPLAKAIVARFQELGQSPS